MDYVLCVVIVSIFWAVGLWLFCDRKKNGRVMLVATRREAMTPEDFAQLVADIRSSGITPVPVVLSVTGSCNSDIRIETL